MYRRGLSLLAIAALVFALPDPVVTDLKFKLEVGSTEWSATEITGGGETWETITTKSKYGATEETRVRTLAPVVVKAPLHADARTGKFTLEAADPKLSPYLAAVTSIEIAPIEMVCKEGVDKSGTKVWNPVMVQPGFVTLRAPRTAAGQVQVWIERNVKKDVTLTLTSDGGDGLATIKLIACSAAAFYSHSEKYGGVPDTGARLVLRYDDLQFTGSIADAILNDHAKADLKITELDAETNPLKVHSYSSAGLTKLALPKLATGTNAVVVAEFHFRSENLTTGAP